MYLNPTHSKTVLLHCRKEKKNDDFKKNKRYKGVIAEGVNQSSRLLRVLM